MKNLALDIGNVLCHVKLDSFITRLSLRAKISKEEVWYFLVRMQKMHDVGLVSMKDELISNYNIKNKDLLNELIDYWNDALRPNMTIINGIKKFYKERNETSSFKIALLSNIGVEHAAWFNRRVCDFLNLNEINPIKHFSCDVGARKPSILYFQSFLQMNQDFNDAIYVDDNKDNLETGRQMGLQSIYFNLDDKIEEINKYNITENEADILMLEQLMTKIKDIEND